MSAEIHPLLQRTERSQKLYERAKQLMPGGTQLLSKRPEMHAPGRWPGYFQHAHDCEVVDLDGNTYIDMSLMGVGACLLGYADPDVSEAVIRRVRNGSMCTLNPPEEVELAEALVALHPWANQVRFLRTGGEAMAAAVRIARGARNRNLIAFCGYHGWHDWYLAANRCPEGADDKLNGHLLPGLSPTGVPHQLAMTSFPFTYNKPEELAAIVADCSDRLAAVVMEPSRSTPPAPGFLETVRELCDKSGALLIFDEISAGWRFALGGSHLQYGVEPDMAVFGKALGNGHPITAVIGTSVAMAAAHDSFISSTYWTESVGPVAALAVLEKMRRYDIPTHIRRIGNLLRDGLSSLARTHGIGVTILGHPALTSISFDGPDSAALMTLFTVQMLEHNVLCGSSFYPSFAHTDGHVTKYLESADRVMPELIKAQRNGELISRLNGNVKHSGFRRLA